MPVKNNFFSRKYLAVFVLVCITLLGFAVRLYRLDQSPEGALVDEMHFGYIAHSLLETGKDEHGTRWPVVFTAFGDYKLPGYAYLLLPFVAVFDMTVFSIRLPSVLLGTIEIVVMYLVCRSFKLPRYAALIAAAVMAFSPWPFILSRFGFESNLGLALWLVGLLLVSQLQERSSLLKKAMTGVVFGLTWYAYIAYRPISVVLLVCYLLFMVVRKKLSIKTGLVIGAFFVSTIFPLFLPGISSANTARFNQISIFTDKGIPMRIDEQRTYCTWQAPKIWCYMIWNKPVVLSSNLINRYFKLFSPEYLAVEGESDSDYLTVTGFGAFPYVVYPLFLLGIMYVLIGKEKKEVGLEMHHRLLLIVGLVVSGIPTIISGQPQRVRLSAALPFFIMAIAYGSLFVPSIVATIAQFFMDAQRYEKLKKYILGGVVAVMSIIFLFTTAQYLTDYYFVYTTKRGYEYGSFIRELMPYLQQYEGKSQIYIRPYFAAPIMYYAFYTHYDPSLYQQNAVLGPLESSGFQHTVKLGTLQATDLSIDGYACQAVAENKPALYVTNVLSQDNFSPMHVVRSSNQVDVHAYIYDALLYGRKFVAKCANISPAEKARIQKEYIEQYGKDQVSL